MAGLMLRWHYYANRDTLCLFRIELPFYSSRLADLLLKHCLWIVEEGDPKVWVGDQGPRTREGNWVKVQL